MRGAGRAVQVVPLAQRPLLLLDHRDALPGEHEEALLRALGVVERRALARLQHVHVDPEVLERRVGRLERAEHAVALGREAARAAQVEHEPAGAGRHGAAGVSSMLASGVDTALEPTQTGDLLASPP